MLKACGSHSHDLRQALERKGLWKFVKPERAAEATREWLAGTMTRENWDPYIGSMCEIIGQVKKLNLEVHTGESRLECPLCTVNVRLMNAQAAASWIDNVTDALYIQGQVNGLVV